MSYQSDYTGKQVDEGAKNAVDPTYLSIKETVETGATQDIGEAGTWQPVVAPDAAVVFGGNLTFAAGIITYTGLEEAEISNAFMQKGVDMLVDGHDADVVRATMQKDIDLTTERHETGSNMMMALADVAPAMGMIGTLIGLVAMLSNMDDPKAIGPAMAVALLTTLYGAFLANVIAIPIAAKLKLRLAEEKMNQELVLDAVLGIQDGQNPRVIEGLLKNYLAEGKRAVNTTEE